MRCNSTSQFIIYVIYQVNFINIIFVQDYVEKNELKNEISPKDILSQSIKGLQHLHSLGIGNYDCYMTVFISFSVYLLFNKI